jgi:hypothetical protein
MSATTDQPEGLTPVEREELESLLALTVPTRADYARINELAVKGFGVLERAWDELWAETGERR